MISKKKKTKKCIRHRRVLADQDYGRMFKPHPLGCSQFTEEGTRHNIHFIVGPMFVDELGGVSRGHALPEYPV
jgi:hypothetical protein